MPCTELIEKRTNENMFAVIIKITARYCVYQQIQKQKSNNSLRLLFKVTNNLIGLFIGGKKLKIKLCGKTVNKTEPSPRPRGQ